MDALIKQAQKLLASGVYDQHELFEIMYPGSRKHYATVRRAIHLAKVM